MCQARRRLRPAAIPRPPPISATPNAAPASRPDVPVNGNDPEPEPELELESPALTVVPNVLLKVVVVEGSSHPTVVVVVDVDESPVKDAGLVVVVDKAVVVVVVGH
jgi:hypothetical protein